MTATVSVQGAPEDDEIARAITSQIAALGFGFASWTDAPAAIVVMWSKEAAASSNMRIVADEAIRRGVYVPVLVGDVDTDELPVSVRDRQVVDLRGWDGETETSEIVRLRRALMHLAGRADAARERAEPTDALEDDRAEASPEPDAAEERSGGGLFDMFSRKRKSAPAPAPKSAPGSAAPASRPAAASSLEIGAKKAVAPDHPYAELTRAPSVNVFIAHAAVDKPRISPILQVLLRQGFPVWIDKPSELDLEPGEMQKISRIEMHDDWRQSISRAIEAADVVFAFWSRDAIDVRREQFYWEAYQGLIGRKLFQALLDDIPFAEIGMPWTFRQIANLHEFGAGSYHAELDYIMQDMAAKK